VDDALKPRRSKAEEEAEIAGYLSQQEANAEAVFRRQLERPPGQYLLLELERKEMEEEEELKERASEETPFERAESEHISRVEAEIAAEIPVRRAKELRRTFPGMRSSGSQRQPVTPF
jgi:hypothetical protein